MLFDLLIKYFCAVRDGPAGFNCFKTGKLRHLQGVRNSVAQLASHLPSMHLSSMGLKQAQG
jgi:hypothetical protein